MLAAMTIEDEEAEEAGIEAAAEDETTKDEAEAKKAVEEDRTERTTTDEVVLLVVSTTLGGRVVLVASYPLELVTTTSKSSLHPLLQEPLACCLLAFTEPKTYWLVAVTMPRLDPHKVHLKLVIDEGLGQ